MKSCLLVLLLLLISGIESCHEKKMATTGFAIGEGKMPDISIDSHRRLQVVYGLGDSILYSTSGNQGQTFSSPELVAVLPGLAASHMRGPQVAGTDDGVTVLAVDKTGDIFCSHRDDQGRWTKLFRINDVDAVAKEQFVDLAADGQNLFAAWLDLRSGHNQVYGAGSSDGGKTWTQNRLVYASPDTTVCECCKPSVAFKNGKVYVMFRNWLQGNRDLYLVESTDGGHNFNPAQRLGTGHWALDGCPMDGGGLAIQEDGTPATVWFRKNTIFRCEPGKAETAIGKGRSCTLTSAGGKNSYAWTENGQVVVMDPRGKKSTIGKGSGPLIRTFDGEQVLCIWEDENKIYSSRLNF